MMKNYVPFALREFRLVPGQNFPGGAPPRRASVQIASMDVGFGDRVILGDLCVYIYHPMVDPADQILMRLGWLGKGFLLEKRIPAGLFINKSRPGVPVWRFTKPYILWPNQRLRARMLRRQNLDGSLGIAFHGRRMVDDRPVMLFDSTEQSIPVGTPAAGFVDTTLQAPGDSPVELHSVAICDWAHDKTANTSEVQIWTPKGREFYQYTRMPLAGPPPPAEQKWIDPPVELFELGEEAGWSMGTGQVLLVEFESTIPTDSIAMVTLRGSVEIEEEYHG